MDHPTVTDRAPAITVVITAFRRRQFLAEAIDSVIHQSIPPEDLELCLVADFAVEPSALAGFSGRSRIFRPESTAEGAWIAEAARGSSSPVITFLDDDDRYEPDRLAAVQRAFVEDRELGYYRNGVRLFGEPLAPGAHRRVGPLMGQDLRVNDSAKTPEAIHRLWYGGAAYNLSSVAVRRDVVALCVSELDRIQGGYSPLLLFAALASSFSLRLDERRLTQYRIHRRNESPAVAGPGGSWWARASRLAPTRSHDLAEVLRFVASHRPGLDTAPLVRGLAQNRLVEALSGGKLSRGEAARRLRDLVRADRPVQLWEDRGYVARGLAGVLRGRSAG